MNTTLRIPIVWGILCVFVLVGSPAWALNFCPGNGGSQAITLEVARTNYSLPLADIPLPRLTNGKPVLTVSVSRGVEIPAGNNQASRFPCPNPPPSAGWRQSGGVYFCDVALRVKVDSAQFNLVRFANDPHPKVRANLHRTTQGPNDLLNFANFPTCGSQNPRLVYPRTNPNLSVCNLLPNNLPCTAGPACDDFERSYPAILDYAQPGGWINLAGEYLQNITQTNGMQRFDDLVMSIPSVNPCTGGGCNNLVLDLILLAPGAQGATSCAAIGQTVEVRFVP